MASDPVRCGLPDRHEGDHDELIDGGVQDFRATIEAMHRELIAAANVGVLRFGDIPPLPPFAAPRAGRAGDDV